MEDRRQQLLAQVAKRKRAEPTPGVKPTLDEPSHPAPVTTTQRTPGSFGLVDGILSFEIVNAPLANPSPGGNFLFALYAYQEMSHGIAVATDAAVTKSTKAIVTSKDGDASAKKTRIKNEITA